MKKIQILAMATLVSPVVLAAAPTASAEPTWWGVINNHAEFRVAHDSGKTTAYEIEVKRAGDANFSLLTNATVEVATQEDFSDAVVVDTFPETAYTSVEILERSFTPTVGRYARLRKAEPLDGQVLTIAELEFLGEDATPLPEVADGKAPQRSFSRTPSSIRPTPPTRTSSTSSCRFRSPETRTARRGSPPSRGPTSTPADRSCTTTASTSRR